MSAQEKDPLKTISWALEDLSGSDGYYDAAIQVPVIHASRMPVIHAPSSICIGSNKLNLRKGRDITMLDAQLQASQLEDGGLRVLVDGFREHDGAPLGLGLALGYGIDGVSPITNTLYEGYLLELHKDQGREEQQSRLFGIQDGGCIEVPRVDEANVPKVFAVGCARTFLNLVQKERAKAGK